MSEPNSVSRELVLRVAREVLENEGRAVLRAGQRLDQKMAEAVELILARRGRLIVSGMGKSGLVGRKISTLSRADPVLFLHPEKPAWRLGTVIERVVYCFQLEMMKLLG
jgi:arabinose-5-phosphate isomerase